MRKVALILLIVATIAALLAGSCSNVTCYLHSHTDHDEGAGAMAPAGGIPLHLGAQKITLFRKGQGPAVLVLHELPGLSRPTLALIDHLVSQGYTVYYPLLFGNYGETRTGIGVTFAACRNGEFHCLSTDHPATPLVNFIRAEIFRIMKKDGATKTVVIGMCLTGPVGVSLLHDGFVRATVMSQPAIPFALGATRVSSLGISDQEKKSAITSNKPILAFRFTHDCISPPQRMAHFEREFGPQITVMQIDSGPCNHFGVPADAHSVLTLSHRPSEAGYPTNAAITALDSFLRQNLKEGR